MHGLQLESHISMHVCIALCHFALECDGEICSPSVDVMLGSVSA